MTDEGRPPDPNRDPFWDPARGADHGPCEHSLAYPCIQSKPEGAKWMLRFADCNCDPDDPLTIPQVSAVCDYCLHLLIRSVKRKNGVSCTGCGLAYNPGELMIEDVVELEDASP